MRWWGGQLVSPKPNTTYKNVLLSLWLERFAATPGTGFTQGPIPHLCPSVESEVITDLGARRPGI